MIAINSDPTARTLRQFGAIAALLLLALAAARLARHGAAASALLFAAIAAGIALVAVLRPALLRLPYVLSSALMYPLGMVASHVLMLALFYGMITPLAALARALGNDALRLRFDRQRASYWERRSRPRDAASYLRQA